MPRVACQHLDVGQSLAERVLPRRRHVRRVGVEPDDPAARADRVREEIEYSARAAAEVERGLAGPQAELAEPREQGAGFRLKLVRLALQPGGLIGVGAERVHVGRVAGRRAGPWQWCHGTCPDSDRSGFRAANQRLTVYLPWNSASWVPST